MSSIDIQLDVEKLHNKLWDINNHSSGIRNEQIFKDRLQLLLNKARSSSVYELLISLLNEFDYYTKPTVDNLLIELFNLLKLQPIDLNNSLYTYIKKKEGTLSSSVEYFVAFKGLNNISKYQSVHDLEKTSDAWNEIKELVIIDDCCGSGNSLSDFVLDTDLDFSNKTIYYLVIHQLSESEILFRELESLYTNLHIVCIAINQKHHIFDDSKFCNEKEKFIIFSKKQKIKNSLILGFAYTQGLFAFYNNTPNNTLGIFHESSKENEPLFPRKHGDNKPNWLASMKENKENRRAILANSKFTSRG